MKIFKIIGNIIQIIASAWFTYIIFVLSMLANAIGGEADPIIVFQSFILIYFIMGIILLVNSIISLFVNKFKIIEILSIINFCVIALFLILTQFKVTIYMLIIACLLAIFNLVIAIFYKEEKNN